MGQSPVLALRRAILAKLSADQILIAKLGGPRIYDEAPPGAPTPRISLGDVQQRDWSAQLLHGAEQILLITIWSSERGMREALEISDRVSALLDEAPLTLSGHNLIDLRFMAQATRRENNGRLSRIDMRFRAITESL